MSLRRLAYWVFKKTGYGVLRYTPENFSSKKREDIISSEKIDLVLDVGADEGFYVKALRDSGYTRRVVSFEPLIESFSALKSRATGDLGWTCINVALGQDNGESAMFVSGHRTSSSLLPVAKTHLDAMPQSAVVSEEKVSIRTLDSFLGNVIYPHESIYLKIDVQGYELFVLKGATKVLQQVRGVEMELSFKPLYEGAPVFGQAVAYLETLGFVLVSLRHVFSDPNSDTLLQVDGIFRRNNNPGSLETT